MDASPSSAAHKRGKLLQQPLGDSSPFSGVSAITPSKRRKLNGYGSSPSTPKALQALRNAFGGVFGLGKPKDDQQAEINEENSADELAGDEALIEEVIGETVQQDDDDDDHDELAIDAEPMSPSAIQLTELADASPSKSSQKRKRHGPRSTDINSEPNTLEYGDDPLALEELAVETSSGYGTGQLNPSQDSSVPNQVQEPSAETSSDVDDPSGANGRSSGRQRRKPRRYSNELNGSTKKGPKSILTPSKKGRDSTSKKAKKIVAFDTRSEIPDELSLGFKDIPVAKVGSEPGSSSKRKKASPSTAKSKKQRNDAQPIVATSSGGSEAFDDQAMFTLEDSIDSLPAAEVNSNVTADPTPLSPPEEEFEIDEETICAICGNGDSDEPNEIVFCDSCELAVHQECYDIPVIPEGEWLCNDCRPDEEIQIEHHIVVDPLIEPLFAIGESQAPDIEGLEHHLRVTQKILLDKLTGRKQLRLHGLEEEYRNLHQVMEQTVLAGEGNSMLVIGARGSGKSTLTEKVISDLSKDHREEFHVVRLNGFVHTDDKLALREIWRQLGREMEVEDDMISKMNNYADTLTSLLALLSHPSEISDEYKDHTAKSIIFILDEFDLFASHPRQTLLYNLFDIAQARKAPIAVIGLTTKIDVVESLEKRVKSRFSHRYVHLPLQKSLPAYWEICKQGLLVEADEMAEEGFNIGTPGQEEFLRYWGTTIEDLYNNDTLFKTHVQTLYYRSKSIPSFFVSCILPVANLTTTSLPLTSKSFLVSSTATLSPPDSKLHLLQGLAELDLALLICAARLDIVLDTDTCNFAMAYDEYCSLTSRHKIQTSSTGVAALGAGAKVWGKEVAMGAWERLIECELLVPASMGGGQMGGTGGIGREGKMWKVDVGLEEIPGSVDGLSSVMTKWCKEL